MSFELAGRVRHVLTDPQDVCRRLGLIQGPRSFQRQASGLLVRCPWHQENTPSCSVTRGADGTIRVRCHGCDESGDLLSLIAIVHRLDLRRDFRHVLRIGAEIAGIHRAEYEPRSGSTAWTARSSSVADDEPAPRPERDYPPVAQVEDVWNRTGYVADDAEARAMLGRRGLDAEIIDDRGLARVLSPGTSLPWWARFQRRPWTETGHRLLLPVYDATGTMRSLRAWRLAEDEPKRLPPGGCRASGLVMADPFATSVLMQGHWIDGMALRLLITEGEPDFLTWATKFSDADESAPVVLGIVNGAWTQDFAARIPEGTLVILRTDHDAKGEQYAGEIARSLAGRCHFRRPRPVSVEHGSAA